MNRNWHIWLTRDTDARHAPVRLGLRGRDSLAGCDGSVLLFRLDNPVVGQVRRRRMPLGETAALVHNPFSSRSRPHKLKSPDQPGAGLAARLSLVTPRDGRVLRHLGYVGHINWRHCESKPGDGLREPADVVRAGIRQVRFD